MAIKHIFKSFLILAPLLSSALWGMETNSALVIKDALVGDYYYEVKPNESLSRIANHLYGNQSRYIQIAEFNELANPHVLHPGQLLKLPRLPRDDHEDMFPFSFLSHDLDGDGKHERISTAIETTSVDGVAKRKWIFRITNSESKAYAFDMKFDADCDLKFGLPWSGIADMFLWKTGSKQHLLGILTYSHCEGSGHGYEGTIELYALDGSCKATHLDSIGLWFNWRNGGGSYTCNEKQMAFKVLNDIPGFEVTDTQVDANFQEERWKAAKEDVWKIDEVISKYRITIDLKANSVQSSEEITTKRTYLSDMP